MSSDVSIAFTELFYGSGSWLGLLLLLAIIIGLSVKSRFAGLLMIPVCIFLGISYLSYPSLMWNGLIMFFASVFIIFTIAKGRD